MINGRWEDHVLTALINPLASAAVVERGRG